MAPQMGLFKSKKWKIEQLRVSNYNKVLGERLLNHSLRPPNLATGKRRVVEHVAFTKRAQARQISKANKSLIYRLSAVSSQHSIRKIQNRIKNLEQLSQLHSNRRIQERKNSGNKILHRRFEDENQPRLVVMPCGRQFHVIKKNVRDKVRILVFPSDITLNESYMTEFGHGEFKGILSTHFYNRFSNFVKCISFNDNGELVLILEPKQQMSNVEELKESFRTPPDTDAKQEETSALSQPFQHAVISSKLLSIANPKIASGPSSSMSSSTLLLKPKVNKPQNEVMINQINQHLDHIIYIDQNKKKKRSRESSQSELSDIDFDKSKEEKSGDQNRASRTKNGGKNIAFLMDADEDP